MEILPLKIICLSEVDAFDEVKRKISRIMFRMSKLINTVEVLNLALTAFWHRRKRNRDCGGYGPTEAADNMEMGFGKWVFVRSTWRLNRGKIGLL